MTKMFRPTGGWISPISITMVMTTPNQMMSKLAARSGGRMIGAVIRMIDTGGTKQRFQLYEKQKTDEAKRLAALICRSSTDSVRTV